MFFKKRERNAPIVHADDSDFDAEVMERAGVVVVDFWASWCAPCRMMEPILSDVAIDYEGKDVTVVKVDTDGAPMTAERFEIRSIPTLVFFKDGEPQFQMVGLVPQPVLQREIETLLTATGDDEPEARSGEA